LSFLFEYGSFCFFVFFSQLLLPEVRPAIGDDLELILVVRCEHHLCLNDSLESLPPHTAQLDVCCGGLFLVLVLVKVARTNLRKRRVDLVETQSLSEVLGVEARGAAVSTGEERIDPRPLIPHDVVQVARGTAEACVLNALIRPEELDALLLCLPRVGGPARGLGLRR